MVVVVTGASKGIGFELIKLLSKSNKVYCVSIFIWEATPIIGVIRELT